MPNIDLSILNQRQTPAFYADVFANRPAAGFVGRIFVSTDTYAFYRDNGTSWDLIGGPGTGTVTGTGANGQVTFWNGASTITGSNDLFWDATNGHFGVNTNAPGTALDVHHDQPTVAILNQTVATNDVRIGFQNNGVGLWRIGAFYNAGANDFGIYDAVAAIQPVTVKKTTGQVLIGTSTVGSGKLVVASASSDNGIQIVGASAPSLRIDSAESGPTKRAGLGISTATNNFIQGSADRDFCIFNGSTAAASPILFGVYDAGAVNVQEAARISAARNFLIGTTTDAGYKLNVNGTALISGATSFGSNISVPSSSSSGQGYVYFNYLSSAANSRTWRLANDYNAYGDFKLQQSTTQSGTTFADILAFSSTGAATFSSTVEAARYLSNSSSASLVAFACTTGNGMFNTGTNSIGFSTNSIEAMRIDANRNVGIGTAAVQSAKLDLNVSAAGNTQLLLRDRDITLYYGSILYRADLGETRITSQDGGVGISFYTNSPATEKMRIVASTGNLLIGTTTDSGQRLNVVGGGVRINFASPSYNIFSVDDDVNYGIVVTASLKTLIGTNSPGGSKLRIVGLPTSAVGLSSGDVYSNAGILTIVP